jgi:hypothetical protein
MYAVAVFPGAFQGLPHAPGIIDRYAARRELFQDGGESGAALVRIESHFRSVTLERLRS